MNFQRDYSGLVQLQGGERNRGARNREGKVFCATRGIHVAVEELKQHFYRGKWRESE